ncbi:1,4-alpha-glucan branching protein GlgB [Corynebacterium sp. 153RC1]|uniref:1,4-alpha-glucan branching protein GlgB n=1 Tax=unclassified Corynebacterium TaxID=2624378 RepID=UPI00211D09A4|nr:MULTISPECIES: 1,4-alpha-glucan branching protein GlgB [unclassified Corynebacterium]MCQ9369928.1 1,4-alpha-glucan branching protein GlgB [Corynebacterium sp. 35RC1]MCQ9352047.1 1,4-alpha-glucan branching protein GlgB [Corynebacterium sp. 209RC1]MCQ9353796.1 1,4-alpha-glucan branching protein GlgB [Corynebacterium sp. 1222RC1]MCQ9356220.1 1,4-alpha-glucan branching protein GlgB [Corynebacterium sp. 122RC1]MCQ9358322.1 1,4-alpha-glucan branching protein GlgB [Corynebacterium sp. 142RC1]
MPSTIADFDRQRLITCQHHDPHSIYGWHAIEDGSSAVVRTRILGASAVDVLLGADSSTVVPAEPTGDDIFEATLPSAEPTDYRLRVTWADGSTTDKADPYHFLPTLGEMDLHLIREGRHERLWEVLGAHQRSYTTELGEVSGTSFAVWAPNAAGVAVIGDFDGWNPNQYPMRSLGSSGIWEVFLPGIGVGEVYKFAIHTKEGHRIDKADPMARQAEVAPATGSVVAESSYQWQDADWLEARAKRDHANSPMSVYEVHLGSWRTELGYKELATELVDYVAEMGYTHVEFLPVAEHPFGGSWGYQVSGYYAPTSRWGSPDELRALIDAFHARGIGVIVDWVPAHFPKDAFALGRFDGQALYEHPDWRRGEQKDWGTYVFDFGRNEVRNFLVANALYWLEEFHVDGLRVDAVASMLYLDYSRNEGEWLPNQYGGRENLEAVQFLQEMNATVHKLHPGVLTIAEESTSWPGVTAPTEHGGLGFSLKWNMGWMNDTLEYFSLDPIHRRYHHNEITFSMVYAYSERYVLPFSHDEVVHGKGSLWDRMPGDAWNKAAGLRTLYAYMYAHPGKKLLFQGQEFGQVLEWSEGRSLDWDDLVGWEGEYHEGISHLVRDLNSVYAQEPALYTQDNGSEGFSWTKSDDADNNILSFVRYGSNGEKLLIVCNFGGTTQDHYKLGVPAGGGWECILNTDAGVYEGANNLIEDHNVAWDSPWDGYPHELTVRIPAMSTQYYRWVG